MMKRFLLLFLSLLPVQVAFSQQLSSPDGRYIVTVDGFSYTVSYNGRSIIAKSTLGVDIDNRLFESALAVPRGTHEDWCADMVLTSEERRSEDALWEPLYGENALVRDRYNELVLHYEKGSDGQGTV